MAIKTKKLSFRAPECARSVIIRGAKHEKISQSEFVTKAVMDIANRLGTEQKMCLSEVALPEGFAIPKADAGDFKMVSFRASPETIQLVNDLAPRFYGNATRFILWCCFARAKQLNIELDI